MLSLFHADVFIFDATLPRCYAYLPMPFPRAPLFCYAAAVIFQPLAMPLAIRHCRQLPPTASMPPLFSLFELSDFRLQLMMMPMPLERRQRYFRHIAPPP
jgi:hypothetical protein